MFVKEEELYHSGKLHRSGRYPDGSGERPYQHCGIPFLEQMRRLRSEGLSETEIATAMGLSTTVFRQQRRVARAEEKADQIMQATRLKEKGYSNVKIGEIMGVPESSVRNFLKDETRKKASRIDNTAEMLKNELLEKKMLDVGAGVDIEIGVTKGTLDGALRKLREEGYEVLNVNVPQPTNPEKMTTIKVLAPPGTTVRDAWANRGEISSVQNYMEDHGDGIRILKDPTSLSSSRVFIRYNEEGGNDRDGTIELRRGVKDLSLGQNKYAQVRIGVDGTHYMKGMAFYSDDIPDGYDVVYNTNKPLGTDKYKVFKPMAVDKDGNINTSNPFKAVIKANGQYEYKGEDGKMHLSPLNKLKAEGDWAEYSKSISSQMLSKQPMKLINRQLNLSMKEQQDEFESICAMTNPAVKQRLLQSFADSCDKKASDLKAAAFPRQQTQVILPVPGMKDTEIYAPNYKDGEKVALVRYPHGGTFEIPILTVNNKATAGKKVIGPDAKDAVGITKKVADKLSGADFDGDTVLVIPTGGSVKISAKETLSGLKDFNPSDAYPKYEGMKVMSKKYQQQQMGSVSNLITDMTLKGASDDEIERAVKHSMVVIDAVKHELNYKQSYEDNNIGALKKAYQGGERAGSSTIISRASAEVHIPQRELDVSKGVRGIDPDTGEKIYRNTGATYKSGKLKTQTITKMDATKDARTLSSGLPQEEAYAAYANRLKSLANQARKELIATPNQERKPEAAKRYAAEVSSLDAKLNVALKNAPRERLAQLTANVIISAKKRSNPELTLQENKDDLKKLSNQELAKARVHCGAKKEPVDITPKEWEAIQAGAISHTKLVSILENAKLDQVKQYASPRMSETIPASKLTRLRSLHTQGKTNAQIAEALGVSVSTVSKALNDTLAAG